MAAKKERAVIACTEHRGVFFGYTTESNKEMIVSCVADLKRARMAVYFGTTRGVMELAETGPTSSSKISARADLVLNKVSAVFDVTPVAAEKWESA